MTALSFSRLESVPHAPADVPKVRKDYTMPIAPWVAKGDVPRFPKGPSTDEMRDCLQKELERANPHLLFTRLMRRFAEKGWQLIFTPPYCPEFQPIELLWGHVKGYVAQNYSTERNMDDTAEQVRDALYGHHPAEVYKRLRCATLAEHAHKEMIQFASNDEFFQTPVPSIDAILPHETAVITTTTAAAAQEQALEDAQEEEEMMELEGEGLEEEEEDD